MSLCLALNGAMSRVSDQKFLFFLSLARHSKEGDKLHLVHLCQLSDSCDS